LRTLKWLQHPVYPLRNSSARRKAGLEYKEFGDFAGTLLVGGHFVTGTLDDAVERLRQS
jgi:hypothetical protein